MTSVYWELDPITQRGEERSAVTSKQSPKGFLAGTLGSGVRKNGYILDAVTQKSHIRERAAALQGRLLEPFPPSQLPATPLSSLQALKNALSGPWCPKENWPFSLIFNSLTGISPLVSNPAGQFVVKDLVQYKDHAPVAMLQSTMTRIHNHKINKELLKGALIAFPNDRAASIRSEDHENFR